MTFSDDRDFHYSTDAEWDRAEARELGAQRPDCAWICTDRDVWHKNPYYTGPAVPHPEDDRDEGSEAPGFDSPREPEWTGFDSPECDDIPF